MEKPPTKSKGKPSAKGKGPRKQLVALPARAPGEWQGLKVKQIKNAPPDINQEFEFRPGKSSVPPCTRKEGGKSGKVSKTLRACHVQLTFRGKGAALQLCTEGGKPGVSIPVRDHAEATRVTNEFCKCLASGQDRKTCASTIKR